MRLYHVRLEWGNRDGSPWRRFEGPRGSPVQATFRAAMDKPLLMGKLDQ